MKPIVLHGATQISYFTRDRIDVNAWNKCIDEASNGLIYGYSYYLDNMADNWDALVLYDYHAVMPLPWRKKAGFYYLYPPFATAQLGVFGTQITEELMKAFLKQIPRHFRYWDLPFNHRNRFAIREFPFYDRVNYVLALNKPYDALVKHYSENIKRNIKKCNDNNCRIVNDIDISALVELNRRHDKNASPKDYANFKKLFFHLKEKGLAKIYSVLSPSDEILSSCVFFYSHNRAYYILVGNHPDGRNVGASHRVIDSFIGDHAGSDLILDFEGSDIEGLAQFYSGFGATREIYPAIRLNTLPWYVKWLKK